MSTYLNIGNSSSIFADEVNNTRTHIVIEDVFTEEVESIPYESDYLEANTNPIRLNEDDLERLLSFIEPTYDNFEKGVCYLFNSPYEEEFIKDFVVRWYTQEDYNDASISPKILLG